MPKGLFAIIGGGTLVFAFMPAHSASKTDVSESFRVANWSYGIDYDKDSLVDGAGKFGYFTSSGARLLKVNLTDMTIEETLSIPSNPGDRFNLGYIDPDGKFIYGWLHNYPNPPIMVKIRVFPRLEIEEMSAIPGGAVAANSGGFRLTLSATSA